MEQQTLTGRSFSGALWSGSGKIASQVVSVCALIIMARVLGPKAYGIVGMARLITGFIETFRDLGTTSAVIQRKEVSESLLSSIFWANILFALAAMLLAILTAPLVASFYREPQTAPIVVALSVGFLIASLGTVQTALFARAMDFRRVAQIEVTASLTSSGVAVAAALLGAGVWSLVLSSLLNSAISSWMLWRKSPWRPLTLLNWSEVKSVSGFSLNLSGFNIVNYFARNADNMIIGRVLGATQLGYYQLAYNIMLFPVMGVNHVLGRVLFPAFAQVQDDNVRFRRAYVKGAGMVSVIAFPVMTGLMAIAFPFIQMTLGPGWLSVAALLQILGPVGLLQTMMATIGNLYFAKGRTDWLFRWGLIATVVYVTSFMIGVRWGTMGVATGYLIANLLLFYPFFAFPFRLIHLKVGEFFPVLLPALVCSALMYAVVGVCLRVLTYFHAGDAVVQFSLGSVVGAVAYCSLMFLWKPVALQDLLATTKVVRSRSSP